MDFLMLSIKSVGSLTALFILTNALGKKQINQLNMFDYVIGISIGNVVAEMTVNKEVAFLDGIIVMTIYSLISIFVSFLTMKSIKMRQLISGTPVILMEQGKIIKNNLKRAKIDINEFLEEARTCGYFDITELDYAIMETNGKISFLPKQKYSNVLKDDLNINTQSKGLNLELVIDGQIIDKNLNKINKNRDWLFSKVGKSNINNMLLVIVDSNMKVTTYSGNN